VFGARFSSCAIAICLICVGSARGDSTKVVYLGNGETFQVIARELGPTLSIRQYSIAMDNAPSQHLSIRMQQFYLDLDKNGTGILREMPNARPCGVWNVSHTPNWLVLTRVAGNDGRRSSPWLLPAPDRHIRMVEGKQYDLLPLPDPDNARTNGVGLLQSRADMVNQWVRAGGSRQHIEKQRAWYKKYGTIFAGC
jgi:hypothetical protein